jgi:hypothetical protein
VIILVVAAVVVGVVAEGVVVAAVVLAVVVVVLTCDVTVVLVGLVVVVCLQPARTPASNTTAISTDKNLNDLVFIQRWTPVLIYFQAEIDNHGKYPLFL